MDEFDVTTPVDTNAATNTIAEDATVGATVGITANATDGDGTNNIVTYSLTDNTGGRFTIDANTGVVTVADGSLLDFETANSHNITVQATSSDTSIDTQTFTIAVTDVDEFDVTTPVDTNAATNTIAEDATTGSTVGITANATDGDGTNNTVTYELTDDAGGLFGIDATTGVVTVAAGLDYETATTHNITVQATSTDTSTSSQTFTIAVSDVNEVPSITRSATATIAENSTTVVLDIDATDPENDAITFALVATSVDASLFSLNSTTGELRFLTPPNFEAPADNGGDNVYNITVTASDGTFSDSQDITITVTNLNEAPTAQADSASFSLQDQANITLRPLDNDSDPDGGSLTITTVTDPENGTVTIEGETLLYTPQSGFEGTDTFTYTITDGENESSASVQVTVRDATLELNPSVITPDTFINLGLTFDSTGNGNVSLDRDRASASAQVQNVRNGTEAVFDNLIGLYEVVNTAGGIDTNGDGVADLTPGTSGYALAALTTARIQNFSLRAGASRTTAEQLGEDVLLVGNKLYSPFVIANAGAIGVQGFITAESAETDGIFNNAATTVSDAVAYFSFTAANPDSFAHLKSYGNGVFGFEDLPGNLLSSNGLPGDGDFNDAVFAFNLTAAA